MQPLTISEITTVRSSLPLVLEEGVSSVPVIKDKIALHREISNKPVPFACVLAHEVRNPLTNINLSIEMLESCGENERQPFLDIIRRSSERINTLINELVKHQEADEAPAGTCSIHQLLDEVLKMTEDKFTLKHIAITRDYAEKDFEIILTRPKMKIALTNLVINAVDAMGTENGRLKIVTKSMADKYVIRIEDNGCGISKKNLRHIFKPYFTSKPGGLGFGLSSTCDILRSNHVGITVESEEGRGTCFNLFFFKYPTVSLFNNKR